MEIFITGDTARRFPPLPPGHLLRAGTHDQGRFGSGPVEILVESGTVTHGMMQDWTGWRTGHTLLHLCLGPWETTKTMTLTKTTPKKNGMVDRSRGYVPPFCTSCEVRYMSSMAGSFLPWAALPPMISRTASWNRTILTSRKSSRQLEQRGALFRVNHRSWWGRGTAQRSGISGSQSKSGACPLECGLHSSATAAPPAYRMCSARNVQKRRTDRVLRRSASEMYLPVLVLRPLSQQYGDREKICHAI